MTERDPADDIHHRIDADPTPEWRPEPVVAVNLWGWLAGLIRKIKERL